MCNAIWLLFNRGTRGICAIWKQNLNAATVPEVVAKLYSQSCFLLIFILHDMDWAGLMQLHAGLPLLIQHCALQASPCSWSAPCDRRLALRIAGDELAHAVIQAPSQHLRDLRGALG